MSKSNKKDLTGKQITKTSSNKSLTDQDIAKLFLSFYQYYADETKDPSPKTGKALYEALQLRMLIEFEWGALKAYKEDDQAKYEAHKVLNTFWNAKYHFNTNLKPLESVQTLKSFSDDFIKQAKKNPVYISCSHTYGFGRDIYGQYNFTDLLLMSIMRGSHHGHHYHHHDRHDPGKDTSESSDCLAKVVAFLLIIAAVIAVFIATYFIIKYFAESIERFIYNEGFFDAAAPIIGMLAGGAVIGVASSLILTSTLTALAVSAGFPPIGFAISIIITISLIGAVIGGVIAKSSKEYTNAKLHADALNPNDPHRFRLTASEVKHLEEQNFDPIKVKCAMVALMKSMQTAKVPHLFSRSSHIQENLNTVRELRAGRHYQVDVGGLHFNLRKDDEAPTSDQQNIDNTDPPPSYRR